MGWASKMLLLGSVEHVGDVEGLMTMGGRGGIEEMV